MDDIRVDIRCCGCFAPLQQDIREVDFDTPWHCPYCNALHFVSQDLEGVVRAARMVLGSQEGQEREKIRVSIEMEAVGDAHFVCAWDPNHLLNASEVARILRVDPAFVLRLIRRGEFPNARKERKWRVPLGDVRAYLLRRTYSTRKAPKKRSRRRENGSSNR